MHRFAKSPFGLTLLGGLLWFLAQPPVGWSVLAWLAPLPWLAVIERTKPLTRKQWWGVWLAGMCYWLAALHWIRLPHPATIFGWPLLAGYMAMYLVLFVALTRSLRIRLRAPLWLAAPIVWVGLEWVQLHFMSGFLMAGLSHSQAFTRVIQIADIAGAYGVSFVMLLVAVGVWDSAKSLRAWMASLSIFSRQQPLESPPTRLTTPVSLWIAIVSGFGALFYPVTGSITKPPGPTVALIQSNKLALWTIDPDRDRKIMDRMVALTAQAIGEPEASAPGAELSLRPTPGANASGSPPVELIIWPESMFRTTMLTFDGSQTPPPGTDPKVAESATFAAFDLKELTQRFGVPFLVGLDRYDQIGPASETPDYRMYNTAAITDSSGEIVATYDKTHLVPFGEYIPFVDKLPAGYFMMPIAAGMGTGAGPVAMPLGNYTLCPSICYETVIPHVIRRQVAELTAQGKTPDVLVNITNDAWYWGSSALEMHLACAILRCVETRTPMVIAANGGLSAVIDGSGHVRAVSTRQQEQVLIETVPLDPRESLYVRHGDWLAGSCAVLTVSYGLWTLVTRMRERVMSPRRQSGERAPK